MLWHEHLRRSLKLLLISGLQYSGLLDRRRREAMRDHALILMYHRVTPKGVGVPDYSPNGMSVRPDEFRMHMKFLKQHYNVVPLSRIAAAVRGEQSFLSTMCAVTFDDGWRDVYQYAFPIMKEQSIPTTIYLATGFIDGLPWFWEERAKYLLALLNKRARIASFETSFRTATSADLSRFGLERILTLKPSHLPGFLLEKGRKMKQWETSRKTAMMDMLESVNRDLLLDTDRPFMNWDEVREMAQAGITFENHTVSHEILSELTPSEAERTIQSAATRISQVLGHTPTHVAYPYGKYDERIRSQMRHLGASSATTTRSGLVGHTSDPYALNRVNICSEIAGPKPLFSFLILGS
ncbi:MAG: hypothetical protein DWQ09_07525 [Proteobacteria bacterium]|nr:MAG: hypothetical protein DWQ09_07525 [Pseudomonadota bacterium]QKK12060.1 MAG: polysaccharide deacetylase family protein [Pseudomonadota bacterium]